MSVALVSAATATATALTVGVEPPPAPAKRITAENVDLAAAVSLLPTHDKVPDVTGGLGTQVYDFNQTFLDQLSRAIVNGASFAALAQAAGVDPQSLVNTLLADIPSSLLPSLLQSITVDLPILGTVLDQLQLAGGDDNLLANVLGLLGIPQATNQTLTGLLALLGLDLSDPLNLSNLAVPGINVVTAGPTFSALKMLGLDLGSVPGLPNSVAHDINSTEYLRLGVDGVVNLLISKLNTASQNGTLNLLNLDALNDILGGLGLPIQLPGTDLSSVVGSLVTQLGGLITPITGLIPDVLDARVTPTIGIGLGAFAAAMAYKQVIADLPLQPGGSEYTFGTPSLLGSLTVLPMILINNPARPDGGLAARFADVAALLGIDAINPTTQITGEGGLGGITPLGLHIGGANVLPLLIDATYEYQPLSDFASWPDAFTLVNNLSAALSPTYMLRGLGLEDLTPQLTQAIANLGANPTAINLYLTLHSETLPMLEPLYLASDAMNIVGLKPLADVALHLANALAPALTTLINIGYANAVQNADGTITRNPATAGTETPFLSFAKIDYAKAIGDSINQLIAGIQKEFFSGHPTAGGPNVLGNLLNGLLNGGTTSTTPGGAGTGTTNPIGGLGGLLGGLGGLIGGLLGGLGLGGLASPSTATTPVTALSKTSATSVPSANAKLLSIASAETGSTAEDAVDTETVATIKDSTAEGTAATTVKTTTDETTPAATTDKAPTAGESGGATGTADSGTQASDTKDAKPATGPKHAKPEGDSAATTTGGQSTGPKHAKPDADGGAAADTGVKTPPKHAKGDEPGKHGGKHGDTGGDSAGSDAGASSGASSDKGSSDKGSSDKAA